MYLARLLSSCLYTLTYKAEDLAELLEKKPLTVAAGRRLPWYFDIPDSLNCNDGNKRKRDGEVEVHEAGSESIRDAEVGKGVQVGDAQTTSIRLHKKQRTAATAGRDL